MPVKFRAEIKPTLRQGDHDVIHLFYTDENGADRRVSSVILREDIAADFVKTINGTDESHSA